MGTTVLVRCSTAGADVRVDSTVHTLLVHSGRKIPTHIRNGPNVAGKLVLTGIAAICHF